MNAQKDSVWYQLYMKAQAEAGRKAPSAPTAFSAAAPLEEVELRLGWRHLRFVDRSQPGGGTLLDRISELRQRLSETTGFTLPPIHIRDDLTLRPDAYVITVRGTEIAAGALDPDELLILADVPDEAPGEPRTEPVFGLPCTCLSKAEATPELLGEYRISDSETLILTHLSEAIVGQFARLFGHDALDKRLTLLADSAPALAAAARQLSQAALVQMYRALLVEQVSIRDDRTILEAALQTAQTEASPLAWVEAARAALAPWFRADLTGYDGQLHVLAFESETEVFLEERLCVIDGDADLDLPSAVVETLLETLFEATEAQRDQGWAPVVLVAPTLRRAIAGLAIRYLPDLKVLSRREIPPRTRLADDGRLSLARAFETPSQSAPTLH